MWGGEFFWVGAWGEQIAFKLPWGGGAAKIFEGPKNLSKGGPYFLCLQCNSLLFTVCKRGQKILTTRDHRQTPHSQLKMIAPLLVMDKFEVNNFPNVFTRRSQSNLVTIY